jgi:hypothetical protein
MHRHAYPFEYLAGLALAACSTAAPSYGFSAAETTGGTLKAPTCAPDCEYAVLQEADLSGADLKSANFEYAYLEEATLSDAQLDGAVLEYAYLEDAILNGASLQGANMEYAYLVDAKLEGADLRGAYLPYAAVTGARWTGAIYSASTVLPFGDADAQALGMIKQ